jgi:23S rRNA (pseudouridine1915-N3)-methyltransferase
VKVVILAVGKLKDEASRALADDYFARLRRYTPCEEREVKASSDLEGAIPKSALVVALEVQGDTVTSPELAKRLESWASKNKGIVCFLIGGAEGIPRALSQKADARVSLGRLTLPHRLARVILAEQLYRAMTILRGEPYARE